MALAPVSSMAMAGRSGLRPASGDMSCEVPHSAANSSGPSIGVSSLVTDANSLFSGGPQLQQSTSINADSYMRLPASPMSFSSNNISGSSVIDCSSVPQTPHNEQLPKKRTSSVTSPLVVQEPGNAMHSQKKSRIGMRRGDIQDQQGTQQLLLNQDLLRIQGRPNPHLQAILHQNRLAQLQRQQQILQAFPQIQQAQMIQQQQQQLGPQIPPHAKQPVCAVKGPADAGLCCRRLMQYLYHKRQRPAENSVSYWRKLVEEYFAPRARKRWCVSSYCNGGSHSLGVLPQTAIDAWHCDICGRKSGKGFEATFEILPRLWQLKFDYGVIEEYLFVDMSRECRLSDGVMVLEYGKAVQESVYENLRVVHEGHLRVIFTPELKIMSWEFCVRRHEEFVSRRLAAPLVNQLLQLGQKYQAAVTETGKAGASYQDMQTSCNMFVTAGRQIAKTLEPQLLNEHGLSKRYVRCLQIYEVVNSMKDLIGFSHKNNTGPIESLKNYTRQASAKLQTEKMQEANQFVTATGPPTDQNTLNKLIGIDAEISNLMNNDISSTRGHGNSPHSAVALNSYQNLLRGGCLAANPNVVQQEASNACAGPSQAWPMQLQNSMFSINGSSGSFQQPPSMNSNLSHSNNLPPSGANQHLEQHVKLLQEAKNRVAPQQISGITNTNGSLACGDVDPARMSSASAKSMPQLGNCRSGMTHNTIGALPSRSNSFKSINSNPSFGGSSSISPRAELTQHIDLPELDPSEQEFLENGWFIEDPVDSGFSWKM